MVNYIIWGVGIAVILFLAYKTFLSNDKSFKIRIYDVTGGSLLPREKFTIPVFKKVGGTTMMSIKSEKETFDEDKMLKPPSYSALKVNDLGEKIYYLAKTQTGKFTPIESFQPEGVIKLVDVDDDFWKTLSQRQLRERHKDDLKWYEKPIFTIAVVGMISLMMIYLTVKETSKLVAESREDVLTIHQDNIDKMGVFQKLVTSLYEGKSDVAEANVQKPPE